MIEKPANYQDLVAEEYIRHNGYFGGKAQVKGGIVVGIQYWKPSFERLPTIKVEK